MRILTSCYTLDHAGLPTYTLTMVNGLLRKGHEVAVFSPKGGGMAKHMPTVADPKAFANPDVILAQHNKCAYVLRGAFPTTPFVYSGHGTQDIEQPPRGIKVDWWTAINTQIRDMFVRQYIPADRIDIVRDFIDTTWYRPVHPLTPKGGAPRVLFISNYKKWKQYYRLSEACRRLKYPLKCVGAPYGRSRNIVNDINQADLVVSWGRGILEGMACGRPVISYDREYGDGYLDFDRYMDSRERNFSGYECRHVFTVDGLMQELARYDPLDGERNRELIHLHHHLDTGVDEMLAAADKACSHA
jgi:glycosyltransferase involved in cell wall biosynthesis